MNLKNILTVFKRECGAMFNSAIAYIYLIVFVAMTNGLFMMRFFLLGRADMRPFFENLPFVLFIFIPVLTMRLWAEDKKENTFELLMTFPMRPVELVLGKFLASFVFYAAALLSTLVIPLLILFVGRPDVGVILGGYLGGLLIGGLYLAIGIFISGLTKEQIVAFVLTVVSCFLVFFFGTDFFAMVLDGWVPGVGTFLMKTLGASSRLAGFFKGVVNVTDVLYFIAGTAAFLILNSLYFEGRYRPRAKLIFSGAVGAVVATFVVFNWLLADASWGRFDLTEGKTYTVSAASKRILTSLKSPVFVKVYLTPPEKMPTVLKTLEPDIAGKLKELSVASGGKFDYRIIHIEASRLIEETQKPATGEAKKEKTLEETLAEKGIVPFQVESIDRDELGVKLVYASITIDYKDKLQEVLPRLIPSMVPDLEYLILSRVAKLRFEKKPRISVYSPVKEADVTPEMRQVLARLGKDANQFSDEFASLSGLLQNNGYVTDRVAMTSNSLIPGDTTVLLVLNPGTLSDRQCYELNKYLHQGGRMLIAAQGWEYQFQLKPPQGIDVVPQRQVLDVNNLLVKYGLKIGEDILMDESADLISISAGPGPGPFAFNMPIKVPNQIVVRQEFMDRKLAFMSRQPAFLYLWGSAVDTPPGVLEKMSLATSVLFTSTNRSWRVPYENNTAFGASPLSPEALSFPRGGSPGKYPLGIMIEGQFPNVYEEAGVPEWPKPEGEAATGEKKEKVTEDLKPAPGKFVVIGCSKMFTNEVIVNPANLSLFANLIDGLALGEDVIQIRAKSQVSRDIKRISDTQKTLFRFFAIVLAPVLWAVFAAARLFLRRKEKQFYAMARGR